MGCGCNKNKNMNRPRSVPGNRNLPIQQVNRLNVAPNQQINLQQNPNIVSFNNTNPNSDPDKARIEKLRLEAIQRSKGRRIF
jgi:hypothetical protein